MKIFQKTVLFSLLFILFVPFVSSAEESANKNDIYLSGDIDSKVHVITYIDFESPFADKFNTTVKSLIDEYDEDDVSFLYRFLHLTGIYPKAEERIQAFMCMLDIGDSDEKIEYLDRVFGAVSTDEHEVEEVDLDSSDFEDCLESNKYLKEISENTDMYMNEFRKDSQFGIPHTSIFIGNSFEANIRGAVPKNEAERVIDLVLKIDNDDHEDDDDDKEHVDKYDDEYEDDDNMEHEDVNLSASEISFLIETIFGKNSDVYKFIQLLIQVGVIK